MKVEAISIPVPWGRIQGQIFGERLNHAQPILCLHGYLDNSNSYKPVAPHLTRTNDYYLVAIDFPGHGFSSKIPDGIPYTPKLYAASVRRVVRHLKLNKFYFIGHSYGIGTCILYQTMFKEEVLGTVGLDWVFNYYEDRWKHMDDLYRQGLENYLDAEAENFKDEIEKNGDRKELTKEKALTVLLNVNPGLDIKSAEILLERGLIVDQNGKLVFTRDKNVKTSLFGAPDHYTDFLMIMPHISLRAPMLTIQVTPPAYGEDPGANTLKVIDMIRKKSPSTLVETVFIEGSHHFHMSQPEHAADIILKFFANTSNNNINNKADASLSKL